ncbi:hypothetical protein [Microbacterium gorillae]|uniref:hypothetical protein n=1 Tax=Microbacterium gorillae TaxID=1231063 RepID=UPI001143150E|nr:hypothetical protein [Microbacterium gorillae]
MTVQSRTLLTTGILLALSVLVPALGSSLAGIAPGVVGAVLMAAAIVVAAVGLGRSESVVERQKGAVAVMIAWAVMVLARVVTAGVLPTILGASGDEELLRWGSPVVLADQVVGVVGLILAVAAGFAIRRNARGIPSWARPLVLWAVLANAAAVILVQLLLRFAGPDQGGLLAVSGVASFLGLIAPIAVLVIAAVAILLALRMPAERTTEVFRSGPVD